MVREAKESELGDILQLYSYLHEEEVIKEDAKIRAIWDKMMKDENYHVIVNEWVGKIVSTCVCIIIPNLSRSGRPYAVVENVVTHGDFRKQGFGSECLEYVKKLASSNNCYKIMLMTGSKKEGTLDFYRRAGFNSEDKTAFIQWL